MYSKLNIRILFLVSSPPCLISLLGYKPISFCFVLLSINHSSYADQKRACLSFPLSCQYHRNSPPHAGVSSAKSPTHNLLSPRIQNSIPTLPTHSKLPVSLRRGRRTGTATPGTNLRRRAERRPLSTLVPADHARRPRTEPRAAGSSACGNVGGAFVAAGVTFAAKCAGGCESRGGGEA